MNMTKEKREQAWIIFGLKGAFELMEASCLMCERLTEEHVNNRSLYMALMQSIAQELISQRVD